MPPSPRLRLLASVLFLVIVLALGGLNARYLFATELHEHGDLAANALAIREARHFQRLTGQYSRWGFSHPGPGWFYAMAAGETLFHDTLRLTPTPWNAQLLTVLLINGAFLALTVGMATRAGGLDTAQTVNGSCACLVVCVLHLAALGVTAGLPDCWMPYLMAMPFACLIVAAASVGAGRGTDLPVLALAGAALLHSHVAQPLFVVPMVGLAWVGLAARHRGQPWRAFPRSHAVALVVVLLTALPVALDAARGADSNLALILAHRRTHAGEGHPWADAWFYCLRFAGYTPVSGAEAFYHGGATRAAVQGYVARHVPILLGWALAGALLLAGAWRDRFGRCLLASVVLAGGLAGVWAKMQDGPLFYFNSWFLYGWLLAVGLGGTAVAARGLAATCPRLARTPWPALGLSVLAAGLFAAKAERFRTHEGDNAPSRNVVASVDAALAEDADGRDRTKYLTFPHAAWEDTVAVALELDRRGEPWRVDPGWALIFGRAHALPGGPLAALRAAGGGDGLRLWHVIPRSPDSDAPPVRHPLFHGGDLRTDAPAVDPAADGGAGTTITFGGPRPNAVPYLLAGWSSPTPGDPFTWSEQPEGAMVFRALPVPADGAAVEVSIDAFPALTPGHLEAQRLELVFNDQPLGRWAVREDAPTRARIPAAEWNRQRDARLVWRFPDAASPASLHPQDSVDTRRIAFGFRAVRFAVAPASGTPP